MFEEIIFLITRSIEVLGVAVIFFGVFLPTVLYFKHVFVQKDDATYDLLRRRIGRSILLGLEFLVAADIINTVGVRPTMERALVLGVIVIIRTFLSFSIEVELKNRLPWHETSKVTSK